MRHVVELLFYLIAGPLLSIFAVKQMRHQRGLERQMMELQQRLSELASPDQPRLPPTITLLVDDDSVDSQQPRLAPPRTET